MSILLMFLVSGCNREQSPDCFQVAGATKTMQRDLIAFTSIELNDYIQYELLDTAYYGVIITAPGNLITDVSTEVKDGRLIVHNGNTCNFVRSYKNRITVRICAPDFRDIQNYATGDIKTVNAIDGAHFSMDNRSAAGVQTLSLFTDTINIASHTGVSDAVLSGSCDVVYLFEQGLGQIDARELESNYAFVNNSSLNEVYVQARNYLYAYIQFSGNIHYSGQPQYIDQEIDGDGELLPF
jgi:hypothetical protein